MLLGKSNSLMSSDPLLHIKDSYYFDVPRMFWRATYRDAEEMRSEVGDWVVRNDMDYQDWEADRFIAEVRAILGDGVPGLDDAKEHWKQWQHEDPHRHGRPFDVWVTESLEELDKTAANWAKTQEDSPSNPSQAYLATENPDPTLLWMQALRTGESAQKSWLVACRDMNNDSVLDEYLSLPRAEWPEAKVKEVNFHLSGKVFIPQPFGAKLKNAYEVESGFGLSRYMVIELAVAFIMFFLFRWLAGKVSAGAAPQGKFWNLMESITSFVKTDIVENGIEPKDSPKFMPLFWTIFFFILGCNLMGMIPWVGSPTASWGLTGVLALVIFALGSYLGIAKFGLVGYLKNLCPDLGLPIYLAVFIVPMVWVIEFASLFIKHAVLSVRLLLNMAAGHLVLLGIMGLAFSINNASMSTGGWAALSVVSLLGTTILSFLELFVAFLQAYVFTLLAALFVGASTHHH